MSVVTISGGPCTCDWRSSFSVAGRSSFSVTRRSSFSKETFFIHERDCGHGGKERGGGGMGEVGEGLVSKRYNLKGVLSLGHVISSRYYSYYCITSSSVG